MHTHPTKDNVRRFLLRGLAAGLLFTQPALSAFAQEATDTSAEAADKEKKKDEATDKVVVLDTFKVTASFAGSLAAAAEAKQKQALVTEVIAAEDIGKLPDVSIAESLTRLPGLATQRVNGRAQAIVIRGLEKNFTTGLLNGRIQATTAADRTVEFDQFPAELLSGVTVYKTTEASLVNQGLAGTIDLQTVRPLKQGNRVIAANAFYEWNDLGALNAGSKSTGHRETFSYVDQFADGKVGIAYGFTHSDKPFQGYQWNGWGYATVDASIDPSQPAVLGGSKPFARSSQILRDSHLGVFEWEPTENIHSTVDLFYSDFEENQLLRGVEIPLYWSGAQLQPGYTVSNGLITQGTFTGVFPIARNDIVKRNDHIFSGGWKLELGNLDGWKTDIDLSYSRVIRRDFVFESYSGFGSYRVGTPETITYTLNGDTGATFGHLLNYADGNLLRLADPSGWGGTDNNGVPLRFPSGQVGFLKGPSARDLIGQTSVKTQHPLHGFFNKFEAGLTFNRRSKYETERGPGGTEGFFLGLPNGATTAPLPPSVGVTDLSFIGLGNLYSYDSQALYNSNYYVQAPNLNQDLRANNFDVTEKIWTGYVKLDIDHKLGSVPVTGNIGTQIINVDQQSNGLAISGDTVAQPISDGDKYTDFVPALNLNFHFTDRTTLRSSLSRQLARQALNDQRAGSTFTYNQNRATSTDPFNSPWSRTSGNPQLKPWRANSFDLSLEHYFKDNQGYWAVAGFYKKLVSYTYDQTQYVSFEGYPYTGPAPAIFVGPASTPTNGQGGYIRGLEFTLSLPGEKLTPFLKGFGFIGNASFFKSSIQPELNNPAQPLPGLSERVSSATFYYEAKSGFSARISARYRSDYRGDISTFGPRPPPNQRYQNYRNLQAETNVDAQVSYAFKQGPLKGLTLVAQGYNLNDEPLFTAYGDDTRRVADYHRYGRSYSIGALYKF
jgi:iron complex outermembrane receptor protein